MKVLVVNAMAPFVWGGAEALASTLMSQLVVAGHSAELLSIPFQWNPAAQIPSQMLLVRELQVANVDRVIALKFPAYLVRHPHKTLWLLHQFRQAYDLDGTALSNISSGPDGDVLRQVIRSADAEAFTEAKRIYAISANVADRLRKFNGVNGEVLVPPPPDAERFSRLPGEGYVFAGGRVNRVKRQHLLVEAMVHVRCAGRLIVAGPPEDESYAQQIRDLVRDHGLSDRVILDLRYLTREEYATYLNRSDSVAYIPVDEDAIGYVTMEAAIAEKPVITAVDSGGVLELVNGDAVGWVTQPTPRAIAQAIEHALRDRAGAIARGQELHRCWSSKQVNWRQTVERLLE